MWLIPVCEYWILFGHFDVAEIVSSSSPPFCRQEKKSRKYAPDGLDKMPVSIVNPRLVADDDDLARAKVVLERD